MFIKKTLMAVCVGLCISSCSTFQHNKKQAVLPRLIEQNQDGSTLYKEKGKYYLIEKNKTRFSHEELSVFDSIARYVDGSTRVELSKNKFILKKKGGQLFAYHGLTEFPYVKRNFDESTVIELGALKCILIEKDGTLFADNGKTEFKFIKRNLDGSTNFTVNFLKQAKK